LSCDFSLRRDRRNNDDEIQLYHMTRPDRQRLAELLPIYVLMTTIILILLKILILLEILKILIVLRILKILIILEMLEISKILILLKILQILLHRETTCIKRARIRSPLN